MRLKAENKEKVRQRINKAAIDEFNKNGYQAASIRAITKQANMTVGNLYRYYKSKEEMFNHLVAPVYSEMVSIVNKFRDYVLENLFKDMEYPDNLCEELIDFIVENRERIMVLFEGSRSTKYENVREDLILDYMKSIKSAYNIYRKKHPEAPEANKRGFIRLVAATMVDSLIDTIKYFDSKNMIKIAVKESVQFHLFGVTSFLK